MKSLGCIAMLAATLSGCGGDSKTDRLTKGQRVVIIGQGEKVVLRSIPDEKPPPAEETELPVGSSMIVDSDEEDRDHGNPSQRLVRVTARDGTHEGEKGKIPRANLEPFK